MDREECYLGCKKNDRPSVSEPKMQERTVAKLELVFSFLWVVIPMLIVISGFVRFFRTR